MPSFSIEWEYLTGYAVATDPASRDRAEWPPHPARVFMALAAAWFETEPSPEAEDRTSWQEEGGALRWLEQLGDPEMYLPSVDPSSERTNVTFYVPVNDRAGPSAATLQSCPTIARSKQPRTFPRTWVGHDAVRLRWPVTDAEGAEVHSPALDRLCQKVTRIGHSSSLVAMRVVGDESRDERVLLRPVEGNVTTEVQARALNPGMLDMLIDRFGEPDRRLYSFHNEEIAALEIEKKSIKGKASFAAKAEIEGRIQTIRSERDSINPHPPVRPTAGIWVGYRSHDELTPSPGHSHFDPDMLILAQVDGPLLPLTSTIAVTRALRNTIMTGGPQPVPSWVSGHAEDGQPSQDVGGHLAIVPIPFVDHLHADGHLMGLGLVFPRSVEPRERGRVIGPVLVGPGRGVQDVSLKLGPLGIWVVRKCDWREDRRSLQPARWTASPEGARAWASVTPVVLDRFPKADRNEPSDRLEWEEEVRSIVVAACQRIGLPAPHRIEPGTTCWHEGGPRALGKRRPLRGQSGGSEGTNTALGDGFPAYPARGTNAPRPQVHVRIDFAEPITGPILLGAGRYLGYGFCKPLTGKNE